MTSCCCSVMDDYYEVAQFHKSELRRARKEHACSECGESIQPGEQYEHVTAMWDAGINTFKTCSFCLKIRRDFFPCGWYYEGLRDLFQECMGFDYTRLPEHDPDEDDDPGPPANLGRSEGQLLRHQ